MTHHWYFWVGASTLYVIVGLTAAAICDGLEKERPEEPYPGWFAGMITIFWPVLVFAVFSVLYHYYHFVRSTTREMIGVKK